MNKLGISLIVSSMIISATLIYSQNRYEILPCTKNSEEGVPSDLTILNFCHIVFDKRTAKIYEYLNMDEGKPTRIKEEDIINKTIQFYNVLKNNNSTNK